jgi:hypothetical protein
MRFIGGAVYGIGYHVGGKIHGERHYQNSRK